MNKARSILLIYQGGESKTHAEKLADHFSRAPTKDRLCLFFAAEQETSGCLLEHVETAINDADAAIALIAPDTRPASSAGNLWLEVGYWIASKPRDALMLVVLNTDLDECMRSLITDLGGIHAPQATPSELQNLVLQHAMNVFGGS